MNIQTLKLNFVDLKNEITALISKVDTTKTTHLQNYLYFVFYPLFSVAESIIILCENGKNLPAKILLRSLFETHINVIYYQIKNSEYKLALSVKQGFEDKIKNISEIESLIKIYPDLESSNPSELFSKSWLKDAKQWAEKQRKAVIRGNDLRENDKEPNLKQKAILCDKAYLKNIERGHFERMYQVIYRQLSSTLHLSVEGVQMFVDQDNTGKYIFHDGDKGEFLVAEAISICLAFTKDLYECGVLKGQKVDKIMVLENLISEQNLV